MHEVVGTYNRAITKLEKENADLVIMNTKLVEGVLDALEMAALEEKFVRRTSLFDGNERLAQRNTACSDRPAEERDLWPGKWSTELVVGLMATLRSETEEREEMVTHTAAIDKATVTNENQAQNPERQRINHWISRRVWGSETLLLSRSRLSRREGRSRCPATISYRGGFGWKAIFN